MLFLIKVLFNGSASAFSEEKERSRVFKVTLGCRHLDARIVKSLCITSHLTEAALRAGLLHPFVHCLCRGRRPISSHVFFFF